MERKIINNSTVLKDYENHPKTKVLGLNKYFESRVTMSNSRIQLINGIFKLENKLYRGIHHVFLFPFLWPAYLNRYLEKSREDLRSCLAKNGWLGFIEFILKNPLTVASWAAMGYGAYRLHGWYKATFGAATRAVNAVTEGIETAARRVEEIATADPQETLQRMVSEKNSTNPGKIPIFSEEEERVLEKKEDDQYTKKYVTYKTSYLLSIGALGYLMYKVWGPSLNE